MSIRLAIILCLVCGPALADESVQITSTTANKAPISTVNLIPVEHAPNPRPHFCAQFYPSAAHAEGMTTLTFMIEADGTVDDIKVEKSSNNKGLDNAAVQCAKHWPYGPMKMNRLPLKEPAEINFIWKITDSPDVRRAVECLKQSDTPPPIPSSAGETSVTYLVMPDGTPKDIATSHSSGNKALDDKAIHCVAADRFDASAATVPREGLPGREDFDWAYVPPPVAVK
jgi:protein TonB